MILQSPKGNIRTRVRRNSPEHKNLTAVMWTEVTPDPSPAQIAQRERWRLLRTIHRTIRNLEEIKQHGKVYISTWDEHDLALTIACLRVSILPKIRKGG